MTDLERKAQATMKLSVVTRPARPSDFGFVVHSGSREAAQFVQRRQQFHVKPVLLPMFDALVRATDVEIACEAEQPDTILGWAMARGGRLIFLYVSATVRRQGIARLLKRAVLKEAA